MKGIFRLLASCFLLALSQALPLVDPGLFVISGVMTCNDGRGYCLLGVDCTLDTDFKADINGGHCDGLRSAFTPSATFVCCTDLHTNQTTEEGPTDIEEDNEIPLDDTKDEMESSEPQPTESTTDATTHSPTDPTTIESSSVSSKGPMAPNFRAEVTTPQPPQETSLVEVFDVENESGTLASLTAGTEISVGGTAFPVGPMNGDCALSRFVFNGTQICFGALINPYTVITSASCSLKIFRLGMINVNVENIMNPFMRFLIRTIVVHEDYRPMMDNVLLPEPNNIGMILLKGYVPDAATCLPSLPVNIKNQAGRMCSALDNITAFEVSMKQGKPDSDSLCLAELETMQGENNEDYYSLACDSDWSTRYNAVEGGLGKPLMCDAQLLGIETSSGVGMTVFTPLTKHMDWIQKNTRREPFQAFNTHYP